MQPEKVFAEWRDLPTNLVFWDRRRSIQSYGSVTDSGGTWTLSGSFGAADAGSWQLQTVIGTASSQEASGPSALRVLNA